MKWNIRALTYEQASAIANPQSANVPQTIAHYFYDTRTYTDNTTTELTFFGTSQAADLSNWPIGGALPQPQFFAIESIMLDIFSTTATQFVTTAAGGVTGFIDDMGLLLLTSRPRLTLTLSSKTYGPWPASLCHGTGGPTGFGWGSFTAEESLQYANNGIFDGGLYVGSSIVIPPQVDFSAAITWPAAVNISGDYRIKLTMAGTLLRRVS